jgi:hypothetical protein
LLVITHDCKRARRHGCYQVLSLKTTNKPANPNPKAKAPTAVRRLSVRAAGDWFRDCSRRVSIAAIGADLADSINRMRRILIGTSRRLRNAKGCALHDCD